MTGKEGLLFAEMMEKTLGHEPEKIRAVVEGKLPLKKAERMLLEVSKAAAKSLGVRTKGPEVKTLTLEQVRNRHPITGEEVSELTPISTRLADANKIGYLADPAEPPARRHWSC